LRAIRARAFEAQKHFQSGWGWLRRGQGGAGQWGPWVGGGPKQECDFRGSGALGGGVCGALRAGGGPPSKHRR